MSYKTIAVSLNDFKRVDALLETAAFLARGHDAHVAGLYVIPAVRVYPGFGLTMVPMVFEEYRKLFQSNESAVRAKFEAMLKRDRLRGDWRTVDTEYPELTLATIDHARHADLVIVSQSGDAAESGIEPDLPERVIMESGRPVLVVPRRGAYAEKLGGFGETAIIGVNGSRESARAMFDALPLLKSSKETHVVWVDPYRRKDEAGPVPGAAEGAALARHGLKVVAEPLLTASGDAGEALLARADTIGADLLVMGAYGHSRMREYVFGGATRHVLEKLHIPVLMSH